MDRTWAILLLSGKAIVEYGMHNDGARRRSPLQDLFAERQVHIRSGPESRYIVLSRSLQIGVAAGFLAIVALLAAASYNAIAKHMALVAQQRTLAELTASMAQAQQAAEELAALRQRNEAAERETLQLTSELRQAQDERAAAVSASSEAGKKVAELQAALGATTAESRKLATQLDEKRAAGGVQATTESSRTGALLAEVTGLRAELDRVNRETETLRRTTVQARRALQDLQSSGVAQATRPQPADDEMRRLQQDLASAQATVAALSADLEAAKGTETTVGAAGDAAAVLATLKEQLGAANQRALRLGVTLVAQQSDEVAGDLPVDPAPLPPPPAPR